MSVGGSPKGEDTRGCPSGPRTGCNGIPLPAFQLTLVSPATNAINGFCTTGLGLHHSAHLISPAGNSGLLSEKVLYSEPGIILDPLQRLSLIFIKTPRIVLFIPPFTAEETVIQTIQLVRQGSKY